MHQYLGMGTAGVRLTVEEYHEDFDTRFWARHGNVLELERQQDFRQPGSESWCAFDRGDCDSALHILQGQRKDLLAQHERQRQLGFETRRVRVAQRPVTPALWWELHSLRVQADCGKRVHIVGVDQVAPYESIVPLPEIVVIGTSVVYQVLYDSDGAPAGAIRSSDRDEVRHWSRIISDLFADGEPVSTFLAREINDMPPPHTLDGLTPRAAPLAGRS